MLQSLQPREKIMLAILGACVLLYFLFYFLLVPQYNTFARNREVMAELDARAKTAEIILSTEKAELLLAAEADASLDEVEPLFNNQMTDGLAVSHIGFEASQAGVQIDYIIPADIVNKGFYLELPVKLVVSGEYPKVVRFIERMEGEGMPNLAELRTLKIVPEKPAETSEAKSVANGNTPPSSGAGQNGRVSASFDLLIYSSPTPENRLQLKQEAELLVGRQNAFLTPGYVTPSPDEKTRDQGTEIPMPDHGKGSSTSPARLSQTTYNRE